MREKPVEQPSAERPSNLIEHTFAVPWDVWFGNLDHSGRAMLGHEWIVVQPGKKPQSIG